MKLYLKHKYWTKLIFIIIITFISCTSNKKYFESFFVGNDGIQYFIKPIECKGSNFYKIHFDIVLRIKNSFDNKDSATLNYTVFSNENNLHENQQLIWIDKIDTLKANNVKFMFKERNREIYSYRFTSKIANSDLRKCFTNQAYQPALICKFPKIVLFQYQKSSLKSIRKINEQIRNL